jgi:hypothetical protein
MVYVGVTGAPASHCGNVNYVPPNTTIEVAPVVVEKPYVISENCVYKLMRPRVEYNKVGHTVGWENSDEIDFS